MLLLKRVQYSECFLLKYRNVPNDNLPDKFEVHSKIFVDENMSHPDNLFPFEVGKERFGFRGNKIGGFCQ